VGVARTLTFLPNALRLQTETGALEQRRHGLHGLRGVLWPSFGSDSLSAAWKNLECEPACPFFGRVSQRRRCRGWTCERNAVSEPNRWCAGRACDGQPKRALAMNCRKDLGGSPAA
jgi:hypothetical protein